MKIEKEKLEGYLDDYIELNEEKIKEKKSELDYLKGKQSAFKLIKDILKTRFKDGKEKILVSLCCGAEMQPEDGMCPSCKENAVGEEINQE